MKSSSVHAIRRRPVAATVLTICSSALVTPAHAQQGAEDSSIERVSALEQVIVTAQHREEDLQDVPVSVQVLSAEALTQRGVIDTVSLPEAAPSVQFTSSGPSGLFYVRGVGNNNGGVGEEGANAFYVDGVYMPDLFQSVLKFNNIERIEILKGPQGTLFGRNSSGGLVHVITREPDDTFTADVKLGGANYDTFSAQAYVAGPLTDTLSADIAVTTSDQGEGWGKNQLTGAEVARSRDWGVRSKLVWRPSDAAKVTFSGEYAELDDTTANNWSIAPGALGLTPDLMSLLTGTLPSIPPPSSPGNGFDTTANDPAFTTLDVYGASMTAEFYLDWATFTSITAGRKLTSESSIDVDGGPYPIYQIHLQSIETEAYQQELRLASNHSGLLNWQAGLFFLHSTAEIMPQLGRGGGVILQTQGLASAVDDYVEQTTESLAAFGEVTYAITPSTRVIAGLRYTKDERDFEGVQVRYPGLAGPQPSISENETASDEEASWRLAVRQEITDNLNVYGSYNRGFKSGLFAMNAYPWNVVEPQTIDAFEIGMKSELFDRRMRLNLAAFHYEIDDYQVRASAGTTQILLNAAKVEVDGAEIEFEAALLEGLSLFGSAVFLDSEFASFPNSPYLIPNPPFIGGNRTDVRDATGNTTPMAPEFAGTLGSSYALPVGRTGELRLSAMYSYNDGYFFDPDNSAKQQAYGLINASAAYHPTSNWGVEFWGRNLGDKTHYRQKLNSELADLVVLEAPRTYGVDFTYRF